MRARQGHTVQSFQLYDGAPHGGDHNGASSVETESSSGAPLTAVMSLDVVALHPPLAIQIRMMAILLGCRGGDGPRILRAMGDPRSRLVREFADTSEIPFPKDVIGQVLGQEEACAIIRQAARQRRHVLLIGAPGGKSMLGQAMAELIEIANPEDIVVSACA